VLGPNGELVVVELNANGVCISHLSQAAYVARALWKDGAEDEARAADLAMRDMIAAFARAYRDQCPRPSEHPVVGGISPGRWFPITNKLFEAAFEREGWRYVAGGAEDLRVERDGVYVRGVRADILWADFLIYFGYQYERYKKTVFPTKIGDYGTAHERASALLSDPVFQRLRAEGLVTLVRPMRSFIPLSKHLLAWIDRPELELSADDRRLLRASFARTYDLPARRRGLSRGEVERDRERYLLKPCLYGGAYGVTAGRTTEPAEWARVLAESWNDESWIVQELTLPARTAQDEWVSAGIHCFSGTLGGFFLRTSPSLVVSARNARFIPVLPPAYRRLR
jgi:hypothetical protein